MAELVRNADDLFSDLDGMTTWDEVVAAEPTPTGPISDEALDDALAVVAKIWRPVNVHDEMTIHELRDLNQQTLRALNEKDFLRDAGQDTFGLIVSECPFPLYPLDLSMEEVNKAELLEHRSAFIP